MSLTAVIVLIAIGFLLIFIEFLVLPGTNIAGVLGIVMIIGGIIFAYRDVGAPMAHYVLVGALLFMILAIVFMLRSNTWHKMSLNTAIDSKVENTDTQFVKKGDQGIAVTRLAPIGKVMVNDHTFEGKSGHKFIDPNTPIEVVKVDGNQLIVKPIE